LSTKPDKLNITAPTHTITVADFAGERGRNDGITMTYVDRYSGTYAGSESLHYSQTWTITKDGQIPMDFFGLQNGRKIIEKTSGTVTPAEGVLAIKANNLSRYLLRSWLELPEMTIMKLSGNFYSEPIEERYFTDPDYSWNLDQNWVREQ
jgi:hypothetical protein